MVSSGEAAAKCGEGAVAAKGGEVAAADGDGLGGSGSGRQLQRGRRASEPNSCAPSMAAQRRREATAPAAPVQAAGGGSNDPAHLLRTQCGQYQLVPLFKGALCSIDACRCHRSVSSASVDSLMIQF